MFFNKKITSFSSVSFGTSGMRHAKCFEIVMNDGKAEVSEYPFALREGEEKKPLRQVERTEKEVLDLLNSCKLLSWDGFYGSHPKGVLDGTMFTLEATVNGDKRIYAHGSQNFPRHYDKLRDWFYKVFESKREEIK